MVEQEAAELQHRKRLCLGIQLIGHAQCVFRVNTLWHNPPGHDTQALGSPGSKAGERDPCSWSIAGLRLSAGDRLQSANPWESMVDKGLSGDTAAKMSKQKLSSPVMELCLIFDITRVQSDTWVLGDSGWDSSFKKEMLHFLII